MAKIEFQEAVKKAAQYRSSGSGNRQILEKMQDGDTLQGTVSYHDERKGKDSEGTEFLTIRCFLNTDKGITDFRIPNPVTQLPLLVIGATVELERYSFEGKDQAGNAQTVPAWKFNGIVENSTVKAETAAQKKAREKAEAEAAGK